MNALSFTAQLKQEAYGLGFDLVGACPAVSAQGVVPLAAWLEAGYAGEMAYIGDRQSAYEHPRYVLDSARSLLMLGMSYFHDVTDQCRIGHGQVARYAASPVDYHDHIHHRLKKLCRLARQLDPTIGVRGVVDTAPLLEREFAQLAGLGWVGKNTMLLSRQQGSWFFLAALLLDRELDYDPPHEAGHCGTCTACLDACPTQAFPQPFVLDATRCISYLTIEQRGVIPHDLRTAVGNWLFGCDICQDVCPWNHRAAKTLPARPAHPFTSVPRTQDLHELFWLTDEQFRHQFRHTAFWRSRRRGLLRNAAIVLGNQATADSHDTLAHGLQDIEPLVRGAAAWALGNIGTTRAVQTLHERLSLEHDPHARAEILAALGGPPVA